MDYYEYERDGEGQIRPVRVEVFGHTKVESYNGDE